MKQSSSGGTVHSNVAHCESAAETLADLPTWLLDDLVTAVHGLDEFGAAFRDDETTIKTALQLSQI